MMNRRRHLGFLLVIAGTVTGCRSLQAEASDRSTRQSAATVSAKDPQPTPTTTAGAIGAASPSVVAQPTPAATPTAAAVATPPASPAAGLGKLAYVQGGDLWTRDLPTGTPRRLTTDGANNSPLWSTTGNWLAFQKSSGARSSPELWVMDASGADPRKVGTIQPGQGLTVQWSPVTDQIAYTTPNGLFVDSPSGQTQRHLITLTPHPSLAGGIDALAWSPDGAWVAFEKLDWGEATPTNGPNPPPPASQGLWRVKADGSGIRPVFLNAKPGETQSHLADWSPDGQYLLYWGGQAMSASLAMDGDPLRAISVNGGTPVEVAPLMLLHRDFLSWSPDGRQLCVVKGGGRGTWDDKSLAVTTLKGTLHTMSAPGRADLYPAWAPNGQWIACTSAPAVKTAGGNDALAATDQRGIWLLKSDGTAKQQLTGHPGFDDERPEWSPDSEEILFARVSGDTAALWLIRADGSNPRRVVDTLGPGPGRLGTYGYHDWASLYNWWRPTAARPG